MNPEDYLNTVQAGKYLKVNRQRVFQYIRKGRLKAIRFYHVYLIPRKEVENFVKLGPGGKSLEEAKFPNAAARRNFTRINKDKKRK